jgi:hypothetical protein
MADWGRLWSIDFVPGRFGVLASKKKVRSGRVGSHLNAGSHCAQEFAAERLVVQLILNHRVMTRPPQAIETAQSSSPFSPSSFSNHFFSISRLSFISATEYSSKSSSALGPRTGWRFGSCLCSSPSRVPDVVVAVGFLSGSSTAQDFSILGAAVKTSPLLRCPEGFF